jgi:hypothetical protein
MTEQEFRAFARDVAELANRHSLTDELLVTVGTGTLFDRFSLEIKAGQTTLRFPAHSETL